MTSYLARLKQIGSDNFTNTHDMEVPKLTKAPFGTYGTSLIGYIEKNNSDIEVISNWWLIHFTDLDPVQVAVWPPCDHAGALAFNPQAIAAEPMPSPIASKVTTPQTANELLDAMCGCGFTLNLDGDMLEVKQARWVDDELAALIKTHKAGLIKLLESEI